MSVFLHVRWRLEGSKAWTSLPCRVDAADSFAHASSSDFRLCFCAGDKNGDHFYVVERGTFDIYVGSRMVGEISDGQSFGELALLYNSPRAASIVATSSATVWKLDRVTFRHIIAHSANQTLKECKAALRRVPLLVNLTEDQLNKVAGAVQLVSFAAGETIIKKGTKGAVFYMIKDGSVVCTDVGAGTKTMMDTTLTAGEYFGERALLRSEPRAATVSARTDVTLMALDREDFNNLLGNLSALMDYNLGIRVLQGVALFSHLSMSERDAVFNACKPVKFQKNSVIVNIGDAVETFYIIKDGHVVRTEAGKPTVLGAGEWFGDAELESKAPSKALFTAQDEVDCFALDRATFASLLGPMEKLRRDEKRAAAEAKSGAAGGAGGAGGAAGSSKAAAEPAAHMTNIPFKELDQGATLGTGTFGRVKLVRNKRDQKTYALKMLQKSQIVALRQQTNIMNEKRILQSISHPFILKLYQTYKDQHCLYMLLELVQGGELFNRLQSSGGAVSVSDARFYAACVLDAFDHLHARKILYRDLKPENLLIDDEGYIKVVDFGFAKVVKDRTYTLCGTPEYLAPELVLGKGHDKGVDYWALGILIYEMAAGYSPFADHRDSDQMVICKNILKGQLEFPSKVSDSKLRDAVKKLLAPKISDRLGCQKGGAGDVKKHTFFRSIDWAKLSKRKVSTPWKPTIRSKTDTSNFDEYDEEDYVEPYRDDGSNWDREF